MYSWFKYNFKISKIVNLYKQLLRHLSESIISTHFYVSRTLLNFIMYSEMTKLLKFLRFLYSNYKPILELNCNELYSFFFDNV